MTVEETLTMKRFPVTVRTECKNIDRIYPQKQRQVSKIYDRAKEHETVRKIFVFGSNVTPKCTVDSDLDLCIDADVSDGMKVYNLQKAIGDACDWNCDMLMYTNIGDTLKETIQKEGVIIYE